MILITLALLGSLQRQPMPNSETAAAFGPIQVIEREGDPRLVIREQSDPPLIAIRLSIPVTEPPGLAGAGRVLQLLARDRARAEVERFGGRLEFQRTPTHLVYAVRGPATAFGEMVTVLRYVVAPPLEISRVQNAVWLAARQEALADAEDPDRLVRQRLGTALFPDRMGEAGLPVPGDSPGAEELEWFWRRWFRPEQMAIVIVGAISPDRARAAFHGWPAPPPVTSSTSNSRSSASRGGTSSTAITPPADRGEPTDIEIIGGWAGLGYTGGAMEPAALAIAAVLIDEALADLDLRRAAAELWWVDGQTALAVVGALPPNRSPGDMSLAFRLRLCVASASARATAADLARVRQNLRHSLLMRARTPSGMAEVIGDFLDRTNDPRGADAFLAALDGVADTVVFDALRTLSFRPPHVVELEPR